MQPLTGLQLQVQVVVPDHEPVPPTPKYCPHVPLVARPLDTVALARRARERPSCAKAARGGRAVALARSPARRRGCENAHGRCSRSIARRGRTSGARGGPAAAGGRRESGRILRGGAFSV